jgi:hypothetical protein
MEKKTNEHTDKWTNGQTNNQKKCKIGQNRSGRRRPRQGERQRSQAGQRRDPGEVYQESKPSARQTSSQLEATPQIDAQTNGQITQMKEWVKIQRAFLSARTFVMLLNFFSLSLDAEKS